MNDTASMDITAILGIFFIVAIALMLGAVIFGSVAQSFGQTIEDNETRESFEQVDNMGADAMSLLGTVGLPLIIIGGFIIILGWIKL